jgi:hypothetical protein
VKSRTHVLQISLTLVLFALAGCASRKLTLTSEPPGALVELNGQEVARTPATIEFSSYGTYDVTVRKPGYQTLRTTSKLNAPWWQWVPIDLLAELAPWQPTDRQQRHFTLAAEPQQADVNGLLGRGRAMRDGLKVKSPAP